MVVLESAGGIMNTGGSPYLQPDYLSPLPTTLDAKKSPLALLAQTCSQIGADSPGTKTLLPSLDKSKKSSSPRPKPQQQQQQQQQSQTQQQQQPQQTTQPPQSSVSPRLAFKPYEANVLTRKSETPRPSSKSAPESEEKCRTPSRKSSSPSGEKSPAPAKSTSPANSGASPIIRSGLEILQAHPKDLPLGTYKHPGHIGLPGLPSACCPPSLDPTNPAFRPPFAGGPFSPHHAAMLSGYPSAGPYVSYARVKTSSGGEALVPVCKDPYCTGCQLSMHGALVGGGTCPSGCTQCDHQKYGLAAALSGLVPPPLSYQHLGRPYICNWISGETYCGKRFGTSDELLQHLRTHTTSSDLLNPLRYPNPPLSPLSAAARYHPYSKPGLPALSSPYSAFNPTLGPYYSPYALYGQRLGAAAVHP